MWTDLFDIDNLASSVGFDVIKQFQCFVWEKIQIDENVNIVINYKVSYYPPPGRPKTAL